MNFRLFGAAADYFACEDREVLNESGARTGKALVSWATVWTPSGPREIGSLSVGDRVLDGSGRATKVLGVFDQGDMDIYRVEFSTGEEAFCTKDHLWTITRARNHAGGGEITETVETRWLIEKLRRRRFDAWIPMAVAHFDPVELPIAPYVLGVLLGDGSLSQGRAHFTKGKRDGELIERVRAAWPSLKTLASGVTHSLPGAAPALKRLGLLGKRSIEKHIPEVYRRGSPEQRLELIRGLMDTDGTVDKKTGMPRFGSSSRQLAADFLEVIQSLGGAGRLEAKEAWLNGKRHEDHWNVWFGYDDGKALFNLERKKALARTRRKFKVKRLFRSIEPLGAPEPARCIKVAADDGLYLTDSFIVTHNTHSELVKAKYVADSYPGSRQLFARETRKSLTETVLPDWEVKVLGIGHHAIGKARRNNRDTYNFRNGSTVVLHGLDDPENILSGEFDRIYVFQAEQLRSQDIWDALLSRLSGSATPYCQATADANPASERHWLIKRVKETLCLACGAIVDPLFVECPRCHSRYLGRMRHFQFRHSDNPLWFDHDAGRWTERGVEYLTGVLGRLRGVRRKRLLEHQWVSEEGQVLAEYDPAIHRISATIERDVSGRWLLRVTSPGWSKGSRDPMRESEVPIDWFGAGCDWGFFPHPGTIQVWAYDRYGRRFMVAEVYKTSQQMEWWAEVGCQLWKEFDLQYIAVDPSANALKSAFNKRIGERGGAAIAISADNVIRRESPDLAGIDLMRWGLRDPNGMVRTFILKDALRMGIDRDLKDAGKPVCLEEEIPEWVFERKRSTGELTDRPDPQAHDHGCFVAGTYVTTKRGRVPVESIVAGECVLTPRGWLPTDRAGMTRRRAPLWRIMIDGGELVGTPDHLVWTDRGWKTLAEVMPGDTILRWLEQNPSRNTASSGGDILKVPTSLLVRTSGEGYEDRRSPSCSTGTSGREREARYHPDGMFTTSTEILATTQSRISNVFLRAITQDNTQISRGARNTWIRSESSPANGTPLAPVESGTHNTQGVCGTTRSQDPSHVLSASRRSRALDSGQSSALLHANRLTIEEGILATTAVSSSVPLKGEESVYCVRVPGAHVIFASDILVANCDAWRYESGEGWGRRMAHAVERTQYPPGSAGAIHRTAEKMEKARRWREEHGG